MNPSYIIVEKNIILTLATTENDECNHEMQTNRTEEKIIEDNKEIIKVTYICSQCNMKIETKWIKVGRFYTLKNSI